MRDPIWNLNAVRSSDFKKPAPQNQVQLKVEFLDVVIALGCLNNAVRGIQPAEIIAPAGQSLGFHLARIESAPSELRRELYSDSPVPFGGQTWPSYHEAAVSLAWEVLGELMELAGKHVDVRQLANRQASEAFRRLLHTNRDRIVEGKRQRLFDWTAADLEHLLAWERGRFESRSKSRSKKREQSDARMRSDIRAVIATLPPDRRKKTAIARMVRGNRRRVYQLINEELSASQESSRFPEPGTKRTRRDK